MAAFEDKYEIEPKEFKGHPYINFWKLDKNGVRYDKPEFSLGIKKVLAFEKHLPEIKQVLGITPSRPPSHMDVNVEEDIPF